MSSVGSGGGANNSNKLVASPQSGEYVVCVSSGTKSFGSVTGNKPDGIKVYANGDCEVMEYAGGFDGYFSTDAGDGHEDGFAQAVKEMLRETNAVIGKSAGTHNTRNQKVNQFLKELRDRAKPIDLNYDLAAVGAFCWPLHEEHLCFWTLSC